MRLHLIRHAHASPSDNDDERALSPEGHAEVARLVRFFRANGQLAPRAVWHSSLLRARETAEGLVRGLALATTEVREVDGARPEDDPHLLARRLRLERPSHDLAIVGHEPHLSALATLLLGGEAAAPVFHVVKGAVLCFQSAPGHAWHLRWHVSPDLLPPA